MLKEACFSPSISQNVNVNVTHDAERRLLLSLSNSQNVYVNVTHDAERRPLLTINFSQCLCKCYT